jgi:hypothetical protein
MNENDIQKATLPNSMDEPSLDEARFKNVTHLLKRFGNVGTIGPKIEVKPIELEEPSPVEIKTIIPITKRQSSAKNNVKSNDDSLKVKNEEILSDCQ